MNNMSNVMLKSSHTSHHHSLLMQPNSVWRQQLTIITRSHAIPCYVFRQLGWIRRIEFHIEGETVVSTLRGEKGGCDEISVLETCDNRKLEQKVFSPPCTCLRISLVRSIQV